MLALFSRLMSSRSQSGTRRRQVPPPLPGHSNSQRSAAFLSPHCEVPVYPTSSKLLCLRRNHPKTSSVARCSPSCCMGRSHRHSGAYIMYPVRLVQDSHTGRTSEQYDLMVGMAGSTALQHRRTQVYKQAHGSVTVSFNPVQNPLHCPTNNQHVHLHCPYSLRGPFSGGHGVAH
jgi:hypothetical protein